LEARICRRGGRRGEKTYKALVGEGERKKKTEKSKGAICLILSEKGEKRKEIDIFSLSKGGKKAKPYKEKRGVSTTSKTWTLESAKMQVV